MRNTKLLAVLLPAFILCMSGYSQVANPQQTPKNISTEDQLGLKSGADPNKADKSIPGYSRKKGKPVVFTIGDSTVKNGRDNGNNGQWGWGSLLWQWFDTTKVTVENHALGGRSSRTYISEGLWDKVLQGVQKGDFVLIQFGHNDSGPLNTGRARASLKGNGDNDTTVVMEATGKEETIRSFGWYMRKYAQDVLDKGATPILLSHIPRNMFTTKDSTHVIRNNDGFGLWTKEAARMKAVPYIDLNQLISDKLDKMGKDSVQIMFFGDHTHTSRLGAELNAKTLAEGIKASNHKMLKKLKKALKKDS